MINKMKAVIAIGGTGGHVFPGYNLAKHLLGKNLNVELVSDQRGYKYLKQFKDQKVFLLPSSPLIKKNLFTIFSSSLFIFYSIIRSLFFLIRKKPTIIFGMGGYASFPICLAASILKIQFFIYENNLIIGKANKILLPFAKRLLVSYKDLEGVPKRYDFKITEVGNIIKKEIINFKKDFKKNDASKISILVLGGSQAAKTFAEVLPSIFSKCYVKGRFLKIYQHCLPSQNEKLKSFYQQNEIDFETFNFSNNLIDYFSKVNLAITRSGSSMLAELTNANIPFISVPLPTSADNHQLKNAYYYQRKNFSFLVEENELNKKLFNLINKIYKNPSILDEIRLNQSQYSDKNVYNNIDILLNEITDEKN